jgi:hypothetical protein
MFQPEVKLCFVRRYCSPNDGWKVFVDLDASEEGRTGGERTTPEAQDRQRRMLAEGQRASGGLKQLGVTVGGDRATWCREHGVPVALGDRDIVAVHEHERLHFIAEVEGTSSGQPEQKLYKAIGQIVIACSVRPPHGWTQRFVLVVHGEAIAAHVRRASALTRLGVSAVSIGEDSAHDLWLLGEALAVPRSIT